MLAGPGDRVLTEHPTYPAALDAIRAIGARPVPVPMLADGWDLDMLEATLRQAAPRLAYVIAEHQNPTGLTMPAAARERLVALARASRTPLVIDEHDRRPAPRRRRRAAPPVAALDPEGDVVITIGSMSKMFWAGLRIGWVRANPALVQRLAAARMALDIASPVLEQLITVELLARAETIFPRQRDGRPRAPRRVGGARCARHLPEWRFAVPAGGLCRCGSSSTRRAARRWPRSPTATACASPPARASASTAPSSAYLRLPYALPAPVLEDAVARLAVAWRAVTESAPPTSSPRPRSSRMARERRLSQPLVVELDARAAGTRGGARSLQRVMDFHALFDAQYAPVYRYLAHRLGDPAAAEDLAAETFLRAYAARASFRPGSPRAWLFTIATNLLRDHARGAGRRDAAFAGVGGRAEPAVAEPD